MSKRGSSPHFKNSCSFGGGRLKCIELAYEVFCMVMVNFIITLLRTGVVRRGDTPRTD